MDQLRLVITNLQNIIFKIFGYVIVVINTE